MQNAQEFVPKYVPMVSDPVVRASTSSARLTKSSLRSSGFPSIASTVELSGCFITANFTDGSALVKSMGANGVFSFNENKYVKSLNITVPRTLLPSSGIYSITASLYCDAGDSFLSAYCYAYRKDTGAAAVRQTIFDNSAFQFNYASWYFAPQNVDLSRFNTLNFVANTGTGAREYSGTFYLRLSAAVSGSSSVDVGASYDDSDSMNQTANNTAQLVYSQNETNGLLEDIIQHISDQLAAMWDQLYNLMAVPWIQNDNQRTNNTIDAIEDSSESTNTTIEQQSSWHANFIIDGLKSLFIPSETYFSNTITDLFDWFEDKFGFLGYTLTYFIRLLNGIVGASQNTVIRFPGITVPNRATNETYQILPAQDVDLAAQISLISDNDFNLLEFMRTAGDIVLVLGFIVMLQNKLHEVESR